MGKTYCIFSAQYLPHMGGVERYTYNLGKKLVENGNKVIVVTSNPGKLPSHEICEEIEIYRVPCFNLLNGRYPVLKRNKEFSEIHKMLEKHEIDRVIVNTRFYFHSLYGMRFAKKKKVKCITIEHGTSHLSVHNKVLDLAGGVFEHFLTCIGKRYCKDYYGVSNACNEWLKHFHIEAKGTLYNSIDVREVTELCEQQAAKYREKFRIGEDDVVITFTGRLLEEKGIPQLLDVMEKINEENKNVYLFLAGDGNLEEEVRRRATKNIIPLGRLEFQEVVGLLKESDIFCLPSFSEGFSTSILEAVACRCYVLTTERGGAKELLINEDYGCIIKDNRRELLYEALKQTIENKEKREKGIELSFEYLENHFTWDIVAEKVQQL